MPTPAEIAAQAEADATAARAAVVQLNQALADGIRQVTLPGGQVTIYQTSDSLMRARDDAQRQLLLAEERRDVALGLRRPRRRVYYIAHGGRGAQ